LRWRLGWLMIQGMVADGGGSFGFGGELELKVAEARAAAAMRPDAVASGPDRGHYPYARQVRTGWHHDATGQWAYDGVDEHLWEVFCQQCGDTDGPAEDRKPAVRQLRGPYRHKHSAERAANKHFQVFRSP
jgi:hypothetical protein